MVERTQIIPKVLKSGLPRSRHGTKTGNSAQADTCHHLPNGVVGINILAYGGPIFVDHAPTRPHVVQHPTGKPCGQLANTRQAHVVRPHQHVSAHQLNRFGCIESRVVLPCIKDKHSVAGDQRVGCRVERRGPVGERFIQTPVRGDHLYWTDQDIGPPFFSTNPQSQNAHMHAG